MVKPLKDLTGMAFGRLRVLGPDTQKNLESRCSHWLTRCYCGAEKTVLGASLTRGNTRSCGCLSVDVTGALRRTHGMCTTPIYRVWQAMLSRCGNPKDPSYANYGGRGITVCGEWQRFETFLSHVGQPPFAGAELDRVDNDSGYGPINFRWSTSKVNNRNKRTTHWVLYRGRRVSLAEASDLTGLQAQKIRWRSLRGLPEHLVFADRKLSRGEAL